MGNNRPSSPTPLGRRSGRVERLTLRVDGMRCQGCANRLEKILNQNPAVESASVNYASETAQVAYFADAATPDDAVLWIKNAGFSAQARRVEDLFGQTPPPPPLSLWLNALCVLPFLVGMAGMFFGAALMPPTWLQFVLASVVQFGFAQPFYKGAYAAFCARSANMDTLITLGTLAIWSYSTYVWLFANLGDHAAHAVYFEAGATIVLFVRVGKFLEDRVKKQNLNALKAVFDLLPADALRQDASGQWQPAPAQDVAVGDTIFAQAPTRIVGDGRVVGGSGWCDESHLSGESKPLIKQAGDTVLAGSKAIEGAFVYTVQKVGADTRLGDMARALQRAQDSKADVARLADKVSGVFVWATLFFATATFLLNGVFLGSWEAALVRAVAVLVVACPCALGLATPAAITAGMQAAAKARVWFADAKALEAAGQIDTVAFDKTGTITKGRPKICAVYADKIACGTKNIDERTLWALVAAVQARVSHPIAKALSAHARDRLGAEAVLPAVDKVDLSCTDGVFACVDGVGKVRIGAPSFVAIQSDADFWSRFENAKQGNLEAWRAATCVFVRVDDTPIAAFALMDSPRSDSKNAIDALQKRNVQTLILSGDNQEAVDCVAKQVGVLRAYGALTPTQKLAHLQSLREQGRKVAMVGDGVNDAPAMACAHSGFAMGSATDAASAAASVRLGGDSLFLVGDALFIAKKTCAVIKQNLFFAFVYNAMAAPLAATGALNPTLAALAMTFSSLSVLFNALRLSKIVPPRL